MFRWFNNLSIRAKLLGGFLVVVALMAVIVVSVYINLGTIGRTSDRVLEEEMPLAEHIANLIAQARNEQQLFTGLALTGDQAVRDEVKTAQQEFDAEIEATQPLVAGQDAASLKEAGADEENVASTGAEMADLFLAGDREAGLAKMKEFDAATDEFIGNLETIEASAYASMDEAKVNLQQAQRTAIWMSLGIGLVAAVLSMIAGWYLSSTISRSVTMVAQAAEGLAEGDLDQHVEVNSGDELGDMAAAFQRTIGYMQDMAGAAGRLAQGDLTVDVRPQSEKDVLGNAFSQMIAKLRDLVGQVGDSADAVGAAAGQLSAAADQS
ncbi:MAG: HAMP domain-containing protein, partial [Anaerolineae bacterium]